MERGLRCTRSQAAPDWSAWECLTLVNEINAVEGEWQQSLASFQKWQLVVENCSALDMNRSMNQCKKKWDALRNEYKKVKQWEGAYWSFDSTEKKELGLPEAFDKELFKAIEKHLKQKGDDLAAPDTEPDSDPEARPITNKLFLQTGPKKQRKKRMPRKDKIEERFHPWRHILSGIIKPEPSTLNEIPKHPPKAIIQQVMPEQISEEEKQKMMASKLLENAQLINAILQGNLAEDADCKVADMKNNEATQTDTIRCQGDKIIDCLGNIANTLNQFCEFVQECNSH
ncbi:hypothetical protein ACH5RR_026537 [Cinchona calisaya]|uniref:Myb/SANT-like DNA-binding domain-containing protein n=1 Tax=Cinchona calisaya TaxID=153742 RepID=A0ABD2Z657_9GENT